METDEEAEEVPDEYVTETSPAFLPAICCRARPAAAMAAFDRAVLSGSAVPAYSVSLWAVYSLRASSASSREKEENRALA